MRFELSNLLCERGVAVAGWNSATVRLSHGDPDTACQGARGRLVWGIQ